MARLEDLTAGAVVRGVLPLEPVTVVSVKRYGSASVEVVYKTDRGATGAQLLFREDEPSLEVVQKSLPWSFDAPGEQLRLVSEAYRIHLAHLFDPYLAVHTSAIEPLPHQISAVYEEMLPRQPLRYVLADDPGAGKTIMTGLLIKELMIRGDVRRCLIVCPGNLAEQWQDELYQKFHLRFEILTNDRLASAVTGNAFQEADLCIARLDKLSRSAEVQRNSGPRSGTSSSATRRTRCPPPSGAARCTARSATSSAACSPALRATSSCSRLRRTTARRRISSSSWRWSIPTASRASAARATRPSTFPTSCAVW